MLLKSILPSISLLSTLTHHFETMIREMVRQGLALYLQLDSHLAQRAQSIKRFDQHLFGQIMTPSWAFQAAVLFGVDPVHKAVVKVGMLQSIKQLEVLDAVIMGIAIDVVDRFFGCQWSSQVKSHDHSVFKANEVDVAVSTGPRAQNGKDDVDVLLVHTLGYTIKRPCYAPSNRFIISLQATNRKLPALAYIDDRGLRFTNWTDMVNHFR